MCPLQLLSGSNFFTRFMPIKELQDFCKPRSKPFLKCEPQQELDETRKKGRIAVESLASFRPRLSNYKSARNTLRKLTCRLLHLHHDAVRKAYTALLEVAFWVSKFVENGCYFFADVCRDIDVLTKGTTVKPRVDRS